MDGDYYNWIERPFIGISVVFSYITISLIFIAGTIGLCPCLILVFQGVLIIIALVVSILAPCIPAGGCLAAICCCCCCCRRRKPGRARGRRRGGRFSRQRSQRGAGGTAFTVSPPNGRGNGVPPKLSSQRSLQRSTTPRGGD